MSSDEYVGAFGNRGGPRSRRGCQTCREKKVKCDETRPVCRRCERLSRTCDWTVRPRKQHETSRRRAQRRQEPITPMGPDDENASADVQDLPSPIASPGTPASTLPCGLEIDGEGHAAIDMYRTQFARSVDTKNFVYSVPSIILQAVGTEAAAMHIILAIGRRHLASNPPNSIAQRAAARHNLVAMEHYGSALSCLGDLISRCSTTRLLDVVLATCWLITTYEQRFVQNPTTSIGAHLQGTIPLLSWVGFGVRSESCDPDMHLSYLAARLLIWLLGIDARAATFGQGGVLNSAFAAHIGVDQTSSGPEWFTLLASVYEKSAPLFQTTWGHLYPIQEIRFDIEHKGIFDLFRDCTQLRLMVAELRRTRHVETLESKKLVMKCKLRDLKQQHLHLFAIAAQMPQTGSELSHELAMTLCWVIPHYYASVLDFSEAAGNRNDDDDDCPRHVAVQAILQLALYAYQKQGPPAIVRVAWPIFMAALGTPDPFQQQWVVDRLKELAPFGESYSAATATLQMFHHRQSSGLAGYTQENPHDRIEELFRGDFFI